MPQTFRARFIQDHELAYYGLPSSSEVSNIISLVEGASSAIDQYCGRTDGLGGGSLVWSTYRERAKLLSGRNVFRLTQKPLVALSLATQQQYAASGGTLPYVYTGFEPNGTYARNGSVLSPIISASGRYSYGRRDQQPFYPDYGINPLLQLSSMVGGPPAFTPIDVAGIDFNEAVGELWLPIGIYFSVYKEVTITYNSGYDPLNLPDAIKQACAALVRNLLARGGTTGLRGYSAGKVNAQFTDDLIDPTIQNWLARFVTVLAM